MTSIFCSGQTRIQDFLKGGGRYFSQRLKAIGGHERKPYTGATDYTQSIHTFMSHITLYATFQHRPFK